MVDNWTAAKEQKIAQVARKLHMSGSLTDRFLKEACLLCTKKFTKVWGGVLHGD